MARYRATIRRSNASEAVPAMNDARILYRDAEDHCTIAMITRLLLIALAALGCFGTVGAFAEEAFPSRPIVIVVPFPPGGSADVVIRPIAQIMSEHIGQAVVVDNRPGGAGNVGAIAVKLAAPDGYTLFMGNTSTHAINAALFDNLRF